MNRRVSIKTILGLSFIGASSFSAYKWLTIHRDFDATKLASYKNLIADLAETIIPETDTPGAKQAGVEKYIINVITNCLPLTEQNKFISGLQGVEEYSHKIYGKTFSQCNIKEKSEILTHFEEKGVYSYQVLNKINNKVFGKSFFTQLKHLTVEGYCLSEIGATQGLCYDYIPVNYEACIPLKFNQKSWATK